MKAVIFSTVYSDGSREKNSCEAAITEDDGRQELELVNIYPQVTYQTVDCFGGAITDAVGSVLSALPTETSEQIISSYFGKDGIGYSAIRTHMDSCDFSTSPYSALTDAADTELCSFSISRDEQRILPWIKTAYRAAGRSLPVILTPWSPPAFMKTNGCRVGGGHLKAEYRRLWAKYICRYISEYRERGINVSAISVQNEPNAVQTWESCIYSAEEERQFIADALYPEMQRFGLTDTDIYIWDHNKERIFDRACEEINHDTTDIIAGLAFHWYSGDHFDALRLVREQFPDKKLLFTEGCIEYSRCSDDQLINAQRYAHDMIGNFNAGMNGFLDWNICLDGQGGPNHVNNFCEAPVMCRWEDGSMEYKLSFDYIAHFSSYIRPGAKRTAVTKYSDRLDCTAFLDPDGSVVTVLLNRENSDLNAIVRIGGRLISAKLPAGSIATMVITE